MNRRLRIVFTGITSALIFLIGTAENGCVTTPVKSAGVVVKGDPTLGIENITALAISFGRVRSSNEREDIINEIEQGLTGEFIDKSIKVVSRRQLDSVLDEMKLELTDLTKKDDVQRIGKVLNASHIILVDASGFAIRKVNKNPVPIGPEIWRWETRGTINTKIIKTDSAEVKLTASLNDSKECESQDEVPAAAKKFAEEIGKAIVDRLSHAKTELR